MEKRAVVAGHICLDIIPHVDHHFDLEPGRLYEVGAPTMATGGAVSNTGMTMHILGVPVTLMGKIGNDSFGQSVLDVIRRRAPGLEAGMTISPEADTSYSIVINIPGTDRIFLHCPGANATYAASDVNWKAVAKAHLFHFGYPSFMAAMYQDNGRELRTMYRQAKASGLTTSMDPGMPDPAGPAGKVDWKGVLAALLPDVDVFMPSADELLYMLTPDRFGQGDNLPPEELHRLMAFLCDGHMAKVDFLEKNNLLSLNNDGTYIGSGGYGYTHELPQSDFDGKKVRTIDMWGFSESQETCYVSPEMFEEFIFPYQYPLLERFGLNCYGCCEPIDKRWQVVKKFPHLRRISVSPWANPRIMADYLGTDYIYSLKPNPADLAVSQIDEGYIRKKIRESFQIAKNCRVEIIMKDNHTIGKNPENVKRWSRIAREEAERL